MIQWISRSEMCLSQWKHGDGI